MCIHPGDASSWRFTGAAPMRWRAVGEARTLKRFKVRDSTYTYKRPTSCAVRVRRGAPRANQRAPSARIAAMRAHYYYY